MTNSSLLRMANALACAGPSPRCSDPDKILYHHPRPSLAHPALLGGPIQPTTLAQHLLCLAHYPFLHIHYSQGSTVAQSLSWELADNVTGSWNLIERIGSSLPRRKDDVNGRSSFPIHRKLEEKADKLSLRLDPTLSGHLPRPSVEAGCQGRALVRPTTNRLNTFPETL